MTRLHIFSIVLDGMPFLPMQLANFNHLPATIDWRWSVAEGAAMNVNCTRWCRPQEARLSCDGTTEFLNTLRDHPRIKVHQRKRWMGKLEMVNTCLADFRMPGVVLQADIDEVWLPHQLEALLAFFQSRPHVSMAHFFCRYYVGANIVITSEHSYGNRPTEWARAWLWTPELKALSHEPPIMVGCADGVCATREHTRDFGLVFDHYAYAFESQVAYKGKFYNYPNAVQQWRKLQANRNWPCSLSTLLPWVDKGVVANQLWRPSTSLSDATATSSLRSRLSSTTGAPA